ncbi:hypothetical protein ABI59_14690 [Acidobacteria bacterium Mor1]|nr:hypothetical protein ABI59_14690 [Acidobacteria bacterium Mor1]
MSFLFGYYDLGLRTLNAARIGLQVAGDNISNASTPGFARRRVDFAPGPPIKIDGAYLDQGVTIAQVIRVEDRLGQRALEREIGQLGFNRERLDQLGQIESMFGDLSSQDILGAYSDFSQAFNELAGDADSEPLRQGAVQAATALANRIRGTYQRIEGQERTINETIGATIGRVNLLADQLGKLNLEIKTQESDGSTAAPARDARQRIIEELTELTGGNAVESDSGQLTYSLPGGPTLVTGNDSLPLVATRDGSGNYQLSSSANQQALTSTFRGGKLGGLLSVRDETIPGLKSSLDTLAQDLNDRTNALTTSAFDAQGNPGVGLFTIPPGSTSAAQGLTVNPDVLNDLDLLAVARVAGASDGDIAIEISRLQEQGSAALGNLSAASFITQTQSNLGNEITVADVESSVSSDLVQELTARRDAVSGVSLDEEAIELTKHQRAYEAASQFIAILNEITEITVNLV